MGKRIATSSGILAVAVLALAVWLSWPRLRFWYLFEPLSMNAQGYREYRHRPTGIVMVRLPGGKFNYCGQDKKEPREVDVGPFLISKYIVKQGQWKAVMGSTPSHYTGDDQPVEFDEDVEAFFRKTCFVLPTAVEWEYAFRAGYEDRQGKAPNGSGLLGLLFKNARRETANKFGLCNIPGENVGEIYAISDAASSNKVFAQVGLTAFHTQIGVGSIMGFRLAYRLLHHEQN